MTTVIRINKVIEATANDDGTWTCEDPTLSKYLNLVAGKQAVKDKWLYVPDMSEAMVFFAEKLFPDGLEVIKRTAKESKPEGAVF